MLCYVKILTIIILFCIIDSILFDDQHMDLNELNDDYLKDYLHAAADASHPVLIYTPLHSCNLLAHCRGVLRDEHYLVLGKSEGGGMEV